MIRREQTIKDEIKSKGQFDNNGRRASCNKNKKNKQRQKRQ
jgi:hypothetical protein